jgi:hypothetical protein
MADGPEQAALYADDPAHPVPFPQALDLVGKRRDGGADLLVIVSEPLRGDERSQRRLLRKLELYLRFIASPDYAAEFGKPDATTTRIMVRLDSRSDALIFELLRRCEGWVARSQASLTVETAPPAVQ